MEKQRRMIKQKITSLDTQEMVWALKRVQQRSFKGSSKPGRYLAYILKKKRQKSIINKITEDGKKS